jgi:hypothetical protein
VLHVGTTQLEVQRQFLQKSNLTANFIGAAASDDRVGAIDRNAPVNTRYGVNVVKRCPSPAREPYPGRGMAECNPPRSCCPVLVGRGPYW